MCMRILLFLYVGRTGFEPATPWSQTRYSTGLNYLPNLKGCKGNGMKINCQTDI